MTKPVRISDIVEGMEMQSDALTSFLHRPTGRVVTVSDDALSAAEHDDEGSDAPEELAVAQEVIAETGAYLALPDRFEINEYRMMERFASGLENVVLCDDLLMTLQGKGAFRRFKDAVHRHGLAPGWYAHRDRALARIAQSWCEAHGIAHDASPADT